MASLNTSHVEAFAAWLPRCRWFSAKNLGDIKSQLRSIDCIDLPPRTDDGEKIQLACIRFETGIGETTFLAIVQLIPDHHAMLTCRDATTDAAFSEWLLELIQSGGTLQTTVGRFVGRSLQQQVGEVPLTNNLSTSPLGKDTSTSSDVRRFSFRGVLLRWRGSTPVACRTDAFVLPPDFAPQQISHTQQEIAHHSPSVNPMTMNARITWRMGSSVIT